MENQEKINIKYKTMFIYMVLIGYVLMSVLLHYKII